jgi:hypothetical protein
MINNLFSHLTTNYFNFKLKEKKRKLFNKF